MIFTRKQIAIYFIPKAYLSRQRKPKIHNFYRLYSTVCFHFRGVFYKINKYKNKLQAELVSY